MLPDARLRALIIQLVAALLLAALVAIAAWTIAANLAVRNMTAGFGFFARPAGFAIGETWVPYAPTDSFARVILAGMANSVAVALAAIVLATLAGTAIGVLRLSGNPLLRLLTGIYVEIFRNTPLLLQILVWGAILLNLPPLSQALSLGGWVFLSQRGLQMTALRLHDPSWTMAGFAVPACLATRLLLGRRRGAWALSCLAALLGGIAAGIVLGAVAIEVPVRHGLRFEGGLLISPEFSALLIGIVVYAGAFIAEVVRSGILAVPQGQWEAARTLGLSHAATLRLIVLPQALRIIIPALTIQYVGIVKATSLAVAIGYPDLFWAISTTINITGHAIEGVAVMMASYLLLTLSTSGLMNLLNHRLRRHGAA